MWSERVKGAESINDWLPSMDRTVCHNKVYMNESGSLKMSEPVLLIQTGWVIHPHPQTNKTWSMLKQ
jgi:hypothetical protein